MHDSNPNQLNVIVEMEWCAALCGALACVHVRVCVCRRRKEVIPRNQKSYLTAWYFECEFLYVCAAGYKHLAEVINLIKLPSSLAWGDHTAAIEMTESFNHSLNGIVCVCV